MSDSSIFDKIKQWCKDRVTWFYILPERSFLLKAEMPFEELQNILANNIDTNSSWNPLAPINRYKKKYKGKLDKRSFNIRKKDASFNRLYSFARINGKLISKQHEPTLDIHIQSFMGWSRSVFVFVAFLFQMMYFVMIYQENADYSLGYHALIIFVSIYCFGLFNYGENYKVHFLEKEFIKDVQSWFE